MKFYLSVFAALLFGSTLHAQQFDNPATIPVAFFGMAITTPTRGSFSFGSELGAVTSASGSGPGAQIYSPTQNVSVIPGKVYNVTVTSQSLATVVVYFLPVDGCQVFINGNKQTVFGQGQNYTFQVRFVRSDNFNESLAGKRGGQCTSLLEDKPMWYVGLGSLRNGKFAGAVGFRAASITPSSFSTSALFCDTGDLSEVSITRDAGGQITQVQSRDVVLNMTTLSSTSYKIDACQPASPTTPFITYTISQYGDTGIRIDKLEDGITWSTSLVYWGELGAPVASWTRYDWQKASVFPSTNLTTTGMVGATSTVNYGLGDGSVVKQKNYTAVNGRTELASVVMGPGLIAPPTTSYTYYSSSTGSGWAQSVQSIVEPTGKWTKFDYFNGVRDSKAGQIQRIYRPWLDAPATPDAATAATGCVETYDYAANFDGAYTVPSSKVTTINNTTVGRTTWTYNWNFATANFHTLAQIVQKDYSSNTAYQTTSKVVYKDNDPLSYFRGKPHSVTHADGTKESYAYYFGTWNASTNTFSEDAAGGDCLILAFHGQNASGTAGILVNTWTMGSTTWTLDPCYLVPKLSTVTETVVAATGQVVFNAENIYTSSGIERITAHRYAFNGNNLLVTDKDIIRSVPDGDVSVGCTYEAGLLKTTTDIDGVQTRFDYDDSLRNIAIVTSVSGTSNYPATTQSFTYFNSGLKKTGQESARSPVTTTYAYETTGRVTSSSEPRPGGGTLTTSYDYPSLVQVIVTLPSSATTTTSLYLDGRLKERGGSGQIDTQFLWVLDYDGNIVKTTQNGSSNANGWIDEKFDWLGYRVNESTPSWGWTSSNGKVVVKTYFYGSTGQLNLVCTQDSSASWAYLVPPHRYVYGDLGMLIREGDDIDQNNSLDPATSDQITEYTSLFDKDTAGYNGWVRHDQTKVYRTPNNSTETATSDKYTRFTQFNNGAMQGSARVLSDVDSVDSSGRSEAVWVWSDSSSRKRTRYDSVQGATTAAMTYWQDGYIQSEVSASGVTQTYTYNSAGLPASVTEGTTNAKITSSYYPGTQYIAGTTQTSAGPTSSASTSYAYSWNTTAQTSTVSATDAASNIAYTEYDAKGRAIHTWGTAAQPVKTEYDDYGRRTALTTWQSGSFAGSTWPTTDPAGGNRTDWTPDPVTGLVRSKTDASNKSVSFTYYALGQLATRKWARGTTTTYSYYSAKGSQIGKVKSVTYDDLVTPSVSYTYTRFGAPDTVTDAAGKRTFKYHADLKLDNVVFDSSFYGSSTLTNTYDSSVPGRMTGYGFNSNVTATVGYDSATGRVNAVTGGLGSTSTTFNVAYASGTDWANSVTNGSYSRSTPLVGSCDVIDSATTSWETTAMGQFTARYSDARGRRTGQDSGSASGATVGTWSQVLGLGDGLKSGTNLLDGYGQLTTVPTPSWQATTGGQDLGGRTFGWTYDLAGNRKTEAGAAPTTYTPGSLNQYTAISGVFGEGTPVYDDDGNMTQDGTWTYDYDGENRLISMSRTGQTLTFVYDYVGRRIRKTVTGENASDTKFLWSGWKLAAELAADGTTVNRSFVWGPDFSDAHGSAGGAGSLLAQIDGGTITYSMPDAFGNIVGYLNGTGGLEAAVEYSPFGRVLNASGSVTNHPIGFSGQYTDWETGLVYYGYRYYNPKHGRFINRDPIEETGGINLYGFCGNSPCNSYDTLGLDVTVYCVRFGPNDYRGGGNNGTVVGTVVFNNLGDEKSHAFSPGILYGSGKNLFNHTISVWFYTPAGITRAITVDYYTPPAPPTPTPTPNPPSVPTSTVSSKNYPNPVNAPNNSTISTRDPRLNRTIIIATADVRDDEDTVRGNYKDDEDAAIEEGVDSRTRTARSLDGVANLAGDEKESGQGFLIIDLHGLTSKYDGKGKGAIGTEVYSDEKIMAEVKAKGWDENNVIIGHCLGVDGSIKMTPFDFINQYRKIIGSKKEWVPNNPLNKKDGYRLLNK